MEQRLRRYADDAGLDLDEAQVRQLADYGRLIAKWNRVVNLVGSSADDALVRAHIGDCLMAVPWIDGARLADIGSGAGLPGLVIAIARPQFSVNLVESRQRKCRFLRQAVIELGLVNTRVVAGRVEDWRPDVELDAVTCRGYSSLAKFHGDCAALHRTGLRLYALKGAVAQSELDAVPLANTAIDVRRLEVPGFDERHLVTLSITGG